MKTEKDITLDCEFLMASFGIIVAAIMLTWVWPDKGSESFRVIITIGLMVVICINIFEAGVKARGHSVLTAALCAVWAMGLMVLPLGGRAHLLDKLIVIAAVNTVCTVIANIVDLH